MAKIASNQPQRQANLLKVISLFVLVLWQRTALIACFVRRLQRGTRRCWPMIFDS
jgi:hypothetical protein